MKTRSIAALIGGACALACLPAAASPPRPHTALSGLPRIATVDEHFQSYNIEMVEVTGGRFWAPYNGTDGAMFRNRPPLDLANSRLRALAKALSPAFVRVSGSWANNTYIPAPGERPAGIPAGFQQVLLPDQWHGMIDFSKAVGAPLVTSFAVSGGTRDAYGRWTPVQAQRFVDLTRKFGGSIYAAEFFNEPNIPMASPGVPAKYSAANYTVDFQTFRTWARKSLPQMRLLGPSGIGDGAKGEVAAAFGDSFIPSEDLIKPRPNSVDAVSYHFYGSVSQRCGSNGRASAQKDDALKPAWLDHTLPYYDYYARLRDQYEPGKPIWNTETAQAACGGSPWASTYLDTFRYLNQLGLLAQKGVQVVMHNTLSASDYALIDGDTLEPRPNYWAAVLWRRMMGRTVLAAPNAPSAEVRLYAHCLRGQPGGVALLAINTGAAAAKLPLGKASTVWSMRGEPLDTRSITVNGAQPTMSSSGQITGLDGKPVGASPQLDPYSISFFAMKDAGNPACR